MTFLNDINVFTAEYKQKIDNITRGTWYPILMKITTSSSGNPTIDHKMRYFTNRSEHILQSVNNWNPSPCIIYPEQVVKRTTTITLRYIKDPNEYVVKEITFNEGTPLDTTQLIDTKIRYFLDDVDISGGYANEIFTIRALADSNTRMTYAIGWADLEEEIHQSFNSVFAQPRTCPRCDGTGLLPDTNTVCDLCNGREFIKLTNGHHYGLDLLGQDYLMQRFDDEVLSDDDTFTEVKNKDFSFSRRIHARKWWLFPRIWDLRDFASYWMDLDIEYVHLYEGGTEFTTSFNLTDWLNITIGQDFSDDFSYSADLLFDTPILMTNLINSRVGDLLYGREEPTFENYWEELLVEPAAPYGAGNTEIAGSDYSDELLPYCLHLRGIMLESSSATQLRNIDLRHCNGISFYLKANMFGYSQDDAGNPIPRLEFLINGEVIKTFIKGTQFGYTTINTNSEPTITRSEILNVIDLEDLEDAEIGFRLVSGYFYDNVYINNLDFTGYIEGVATSSYIDTDLIEGENLIFQSDYSGNVFVAYRFGDDYDEIDSAEWSDYYYFPIDVVIEASLMQVRLFLQPKSDFSYSHIRTLELYSTYYSTKDLMYAPHYSLSLPFFSGQNYWWNKNNPREWWEWIKYKTTCGVVPQLDLYIPYGEDEEKLDYNPYIEDLIGITEAYFLDAVSVTYPITIAEFDFTDDVGDPDGWDIEEPANTDVFIEGTVGTQTDVLALEDQSGGGRCLASVTMEANCIGYIDFKFRVTDSAYTVYIDIRNEADNNIIALRNVNRKFYNYCSVPATLILDPLSSNTWYDMKVIFNKTNWKIFIDGTEYGPYDFANPMGDGIVKFLCKTNTAQSGVTVYIDDFKNVKLDEC